MARSAQEEKLCVIVPNDLLKSLKSRWTMRPTIHYPHPHLHAISLSSPKRRKILLDHCRLSRWWIRSGIKREGRHDWWRIISIFAWNTWRRYCPGKTRTTLGKCKHFRPCHDHWPFLTTPEAAVALQCFINFHNCRKKNFPGQPDSPRSSRSRWLEFRMWCRRSEARRPLRRSPSSRGIDEVCVKNDGMEYLMTEAERKLRASRKARRRIVQNDEKRGREMK